MVFLTALLVGLTASSALVIGGVLGAFVNPSQKIIAVLFVGVRRGSFDHGSGL
jgi:hypothetical protein